MTDRAREIAHKFCEECDYPKWREEHHKRCDALTADIVRYVGEVREAMRDDARERGAVYPEDLRND